MYNEKDYVAKKATAQTKLDEYVAKVNADKPAANEIAGAKEALDAAVADYNKLVMSDAYERLFLTPRDMSQKPSGDDLLACAAAIANDPAAHLKSVDPLGRALKAYRFAGLMKAKFKRDKDTGRISDASLSCVADDDAADKKTVYRLRDIEAKWDELQTAQNVAQKVPLMHSPMYATLVQRMRRLFTARSLSLGGYSIPSGVTADYIVYTADGKGVPVSELTDEQKKALDDKVTVKALKAELQELVDAVYFDSTGRKNGSNKYRVVERDVHWLVDNAHKFDERRHKTVMMTADTAFELTFCVVAHIVTGNAYDAILGE